MQSDRSAVVFNIQRFCIHDGPGIRTTVFIKGCSLACCWCANPEAISPRPELGVIVARCDKCGKCLGVCPESALTLDDNGLRVDRPKCSACGKCAEVCFPQALALYGKETTVAEVVELIRRDLPFYQGSSGGVTASGGEPLTQPEFVTSLFQACHDLGIDTCLETAGQTSPEALGRVLAHTNCVLFDIKHLNPEAHRRYTGKGNELILANARIVATSGVQMLCRMPLIPGANDKAENIADTAAFLKSLDNASIELIPYHRLGKSKYQALYRPYPLEDIEPPATSQVKAVVQRFEEHGIKCTVSV